jgi:hypothetical protein
MGANSWQPSSSSSPSSAPYRENTLKSFQRAVECGASFLEFDVQVTSDGGWLLCTNGTCASSDCRWNRFVAGLAATSSQQPLRHPTVQVCL